MEALNKLKKFYEELTPFISKFEFYRIGTSENVFCAYATIPDGCAP